ncbi:hypothetical protein EYC95_04550 [Pseudomonas sp. BGI-2]|nr:hypothetical protein EYC95_04550 [Pseudomonas sp. BGI-2]
MNRQWMKRARGSAPECLKVKPVQNVKQSDNRLSVRLSNRLLSRYRSKKASRASLAPTDSPRSRTSLIL